MTESVVVRLAVKNVGAIEPHELGNVIKTIVREHRMAEGWKAEAIRTFNAEHGDHYVVTFHGLLEPIDRQRKVVLV
jgi:hypothetical protein